MANDPADSRWWRNLAPSDWLKIVASLTAATFAAIGVWLILSMGSALSQRNVIVDYLACSDANATRFYSGITDLLAAGRDPVKVQAATEKVNDANRALSDPADPRYCVPPPK